MATTGPLADFARLPPQRKVLVFVVVGMLLGALYYQFFYKGLVKDVEDAENEHNAKSGQNARMASQLPEYEKLKSTYTELQRRVAENQKALPTQAELPAFFDTLNRKVKDAGVEITQWSQGGEEAVDAFYKVPVKIEITGTFLQIKRFFASLVEKSSGSSDDQKAERERIVSIEALAIGDAKVKNRELILTAKFTATTFRQDEQKTTVKPVTGNVAPAPAPDSTAPPMPSAATPDGAKVRVDAAMKKDEQRVEKGIDDAKAGDPKAGGGSARLKDGK